MSWMEVIQLCLDTSYRCKPDVLTGVIFLMLNTKQFFLRIIVRSMPRIERAKKDAEKILKNIANATGQTTIASFFTKKTEDSADTTQTSEDVGKAIERS